MAKAIPVFPDDGSSMTLPEVSFPSLSAERIIAFAIRSFTEPAGF